MRGEAEGRSCSWPGYPSHRVICSPGTCQGRHQLPPLEHDSVCWLSGVVGAKLCAWRTVVLQRLQFPFRSNERDPNGGSWETATKGQWQQSPPLLQDSRGALWLQRAPACQKGLLIPFIIWLCLNVEQEDPILSSPLISIL